MYVDLPLAFARSLAPVLTQPRSLPLLFSRRSLADLARTPLSFPGRLHPSTSSNMDLINKLIIKGQTGTEDFAEMCESRSCPPSHPALLPGSGEGLLAYHSLPCSSQMLANRSTALTYVGFPPFPFPEPNRRRGHSAFPRSSATHTSLR